MNNKKVISNFLWRFIERCGAQGVTFLVSIILARLLDPAVYGLIALMTVFTSIVQTFVDSGMGNALIQKKDADDLDFSSVFYFNIVMCCVLYAIMFFAAPYIARFYNMPDLIAPIRVLSIIILISGVKNIQQSYVARHLLYKKFFFATLGGTIGAAIIGIWMAYAGYGVWALVVQMIFNAGLDTIILWITVRWRPKKCFSFARLKLLFSFGWKVLASSLIDTVYNDLTQLVIGKKYSSSDLAYYNQGKKFPNTFISNINTAINSVLFPILSREQDEKNRLKAMTRRSIKTSIFTMAPIMIGLAACGEQLIRVVLTEKWLPSLPYLWIFCVVYMVYPLQTANLDAIKAMGRSDLYLKLEIIKKIIGILILVVTMHFGVLVMALGVMVTRVLYQVINAIPNRKLLDYSFVAQMKDIFPSIFSAGLMGIIVYLIKYLRFNDLITLIIQIPLGVIVYIVISRFFQKDNLYYAMSLIKSIKKRRTNHT